MTKGYWNARPSHTEASGACLKKLLGWIFTTPCGGQKEILSVAVDVRVLPFPALPLSDPQGIAQIMKLSALSDNF